MHLIDDFFARHPLETVDNLMDGVGGMWNDSARIRRVLIHCVERTSLVGLRSSLEPLTDEPNSDYFGISLSVRISIIYKAGTLLIGTWKVKSNLAMKNKGDQRLTRDSASNGILSSRPISNFSFLGFRLSKIFFKRVTP